MKIIKIFILIAVLISFFVYMKKHGEEECKKEQYRIDHGIAKLSWQLRNLK